MEGEIERIKILLGLNFFIHKRIFDVSKNGYISKDQALIVMRRNHNIPKDECPIIIRSLEILGLIEDEGKYFKINKLNKSREELIHDYKKKMGII